MKTLAKITLSVFLFLSAITYALLQSPENNRIVTVEQGVDNSGLSAPTETRKTASVPATKNTTLQKNENLSARSKSDLVSHLKVAKSLFSSRDPVKIPKAVRSQYLGERKIRDPINEIKHSRVIEQAATRDELGNQYKVKIYDVESVTGFETSPRIRFEEVLYQNGAKSEVFYVANQLLIKLQTANASSIFYSAINSIDGKVVSGTPESGYLVVEIPDASIDGYNRAREALEDSLEGEAVVIRNELVFVAG